MEGIQLPGIAVGQGEIQEDNVRHGTRAEILEGSADPVGDLDLETRIA